MSRAIWAVLGIAATHDLNEIRRAYSARLKVTNPEDDAEAFQELRAAYEQALRLAARPTQAGQRQETVAARPPDLRKSSPPAQKQPAAEPAMPDPPPAPESEAVEPPGGAAQPAVYLAVDEDAHAALCNALAALIGDPEARPEQLYDAAKRILASPAMDSVEVYERTEYWLASLVLRNPPRSDVLVDLLFSVFRWSDARSARNPGIGQAMLARRDDLAFVAKIGLGRPGRSPPVKALTSEPSRMRRLSNQFSPGLAGRVRQMLTTINSFHPAVAARLDARAVAWWREFLSQPQVSAGILLICFIQTLVTHAQFSVLNGWPPLARLSFEFGAFLLFNVAWVYLVERPRKRLQQANLEDRRPWAALGWAPLALALLAFSALDISSPSVWGVAAASILLVGWAYVTGRPDRRQLGYALPMSFNYPFGALLYLTQPVWRPGARTPWQLQTIFSYAYLAIFWLEQRMDLGPAAWLQMIMPVGASVIAYSVGAASLQAFWRARTPVWRICFLAGLGALAVAAPVLAWLSLSSGLTRDLAAAYVSILVLVHKPSAEDLSAAMRKARDLSMRLGWIGWLVVFNTEGIRQTDGTVLVFDSCWLATGVALTAIGALRPALAALRYR